MSELAAGQAGWRNISEAKDGHNSNSRMYLVKVQKDEAIKSREVPEAPRDAAVEAVD